VELAS